MKKHFLFQITFCYLLFLNNLIVAQDYFLSGHFIDFSKKVLNDYEYQSFFRPFTGVENNIYEDLIFNTNSSEKNLLLRKIFDENLIIEHNERFKILINPALNFSYYQNLSGPNGYKNTRGAIIQGNLDSKIFFYSVLEETQAAYPFLDNSIYDNFRIIPGIGRIKPLSGYNEFDFGNSYAAISYKTNSNINFSIGYDRIFIGDGYRSMIISDFSAPLFFFKSSFNFKHIEISNIFIKSLNPNFNNILNLTNYLGENALYPCKYISFNYVKIKPLEKFNFNIIQATVLSQELSVLKNLFYNFTPAINFLFSRIDSSKLNFLGGLNIARFDNKLGIFYSQLFFDKIIENPEFAFQIGYKNFNFLKSNLFILLEYNYASKAMYLNPDNLSLHYGHYNMPLAHPAGRNISELVIIANYNLKKFEILAKSNFYFNKQNFNILNPNFNYEAQSLKHCFDFQLIYNLNKRNRSQIFAGVFFKNYDSISEANIFLNFGFRNAIRNNYYDF